MRRVATLLALAVSVLPCAAVGDSAPLVEQRECAVEVGLLCPDLQHGSVEMARCLQDRARWLSEDCKAWAFKSLEKGPPRDMRVACRDDFETHCAELGSDARRPDVLRCLKAHDESLSDECRRSLATRAKRPRPPPPNCMALWRSLCPETESSHALRDCVSSKRSELPRECRPGSSRRLN